MIPVSPVEKLTLTIFGAVTELERNYIRRRQRERIAIARAETLYRISPGRLHR